MLIEFSVGNFKSFKEKATLSMVATNIKEFQEENTVTINDKLKVLRSAAIYGPNAGGKSTLLKAMNKMSQFVRNSVSKNEPGKISWIKKHALSEDMKSLPSFFETILFKEDQIYRYGFELTDEKVINEWLFTEKNGKEIELFTRENTTNIKVNEKLFVEGEGLQAKTRENALFLTVVAQFNGSISEKISEWFGVFSLFDGHESEGLANFFTRRLTAVNSDMLSTVGKMLSAADFGIRNISINKNESLIGFDKTDMSDEEKRSIFVKTKAIPFNTEHNFYDESGAPKGIVKFDLFKDGSLGSQRLFSMLGPVLTYLMAGGVLIIDEIDSSIHPKIVWKIIKLFNSIKTNKNRAQLIFSTHDSSILSKNILRRDQMWFIEKNDFGASKLYSLSEYKLKTQKVRNDASYEKDYLAGKYGAVPSISSSFEEAAEAFLKDSNITLSGDKK